MFFMNLYSRCVAIMITDTLLFSCSPVIYPCILDYEALFLIYIHNMDSIIHPISRRSHTLGSVSVRWNNDEYISNNSYVLLVGIVLFESILIKLKAFS